MAENGQRIPPRPTSSGYWETWTPSEIEREMERVLEDAHDYVKVDSMAEDVPAPGSFTPLYRHADDCRGCSALAAIECLTDRVRRG